MKLIVTRPEHDDATYCLSQWFTLILKECQNKGIKYIDLHREKANQKQVHEVLLKNPAKLIVFNGHGSIDSIAGHKNEILIKTDSSKALLKNKIVYAIACDSATKLGPDCIAQGTSAYIGYKLPFIILSNPNKGFFPLQDEFTIPIMEPSNEITLALIKGNSVEKAYTKSQLKFDYYIKKYQKSDSPVEAQNILPILYWNKMAQTKLGDDKTKIE